MRTTIMLDDDLAARLDLEARRSGRSFEAVVDETLRRGLLARSAAPPAGFAVRSRPLGLRFGSYDDIESLLDEAEGEAHQ